MTSEHIYHQAFQTERIVEVRNPRSTRADRPEVLPVIEKYARNNGFDYASIEVDRPRAEMLKVLESEIDSATTVVGIGGDGTINTCAGAAGRASAALAIIPRGDANDSSHSINGRITNPLDIISAGVYPATMLDIIALNGTREVLRQRAVNNFGAGYIGDFISLLDSPEFRKKRDQIKDWPRALNMLATAGIARQIGWRLKQNRETLPGLKITPDKLLLNNVQFDLSQEQNEHINLILALVGQAAKFIHPAGGDRNFTDNGFMLLSQHFGASTTDDIGLFGHVMMRGLNGHEIYGAAYHFAEPTIVPMQIDGEPMAPLITDLRISSTTGLVHSPLADTKPALRPQRVLNPSNGCIA